MTIILLMLTACPCLLNVTLGIQGWPANQLTACLGVRARCHGTLRAS